jgi:ABC-type glucose/galactose transport system permease subunit
VKQSVNVQFIMFQRVKNRVTLFLKPQLARLMHLNSLAVISLSVSSLNDIIFSLVCAHFIPTLSTVRRNYAVNTLWHSVWKSTLAVYNNATSEPSVQLRILQPVLFRRWFM